MKKKNISVILFILFMVVCYANFYSIGYKQKKPIDEIEATAEIFDYDRIIISDTEDMGQEYIDKIYFVGDSTTYHLHKGGIDKSHIFIPESLTLKLDSNIDKIYVGKEKHTIAHSVSESKAPILIITLGVNGADKFSEQQFKTYYKKLIDSIMIASPNTQIIIQSVFPVAKWYSNLDMGITNKGIDRINEWAKQLAYEKGLNYLDTQTILKNGSGAMIDEYDAGDGVHMNASAYKEIVNYIRTHGIQMEE